MKDFFKYFLITLITLWLLGFLYIFSNNSNSNFKYYSLNHNQADLFNEEARMELLERVKRAEEDVKDLQLKNQKNEIVIKNLRDQAKTYEKLYENSNKKIVENQLQTINSSPVTENVPSYQFEKLRRKIFNDIKDVSYFVKTQIDFLNNNQDHKSKIEFIKENFQDRINLLVAEVYNLSLSDNLGKWRKTESLSLAQKVQTRFTELQNPKNCESAKKLICDLNKACGFGCQMHHVMYCFITAFFTDRTMILESNGWRYNSEGYEVYFKPVSETCKQSDDPQIGWNENRNNQEAKAIKMPIIDVLNQKPLFLPLNIPKEYKDSLSRFHGDPFVWWAGQILSYLMRFNPSFEKVVNEKRDSLKFETPCVGVHVRRTDKIGTEASFHGLEEYMKHVKEFFDQYDLKNGKKSKRTVYLATDELEVLKEAKANYKEYNFVMDEKNAETASLNQRYSPYSAQGVIFDIHFLSQCDYLVCTFSSQVCRMAYELMQTRYPDASWRFKSLDDVYYFGGQIQHDVIAVLDHSPIESAGEIEIKVGDRISLAGNHWNGYSKGKNKRTNMIGLFPSYKVINAVDSF